MKTRRQMRLALAVPLLVAACGVGHPSSSQSGETARSLGASVSGNGTPSAPSTNSRGNIVTTLGQRLPMAASGQAGTGTWTLDKITPDPQCTVSGARHPQNGHYIRLDVHGWTDPPAPGPRPSYGLPGVTEADFQFIRANGVTFPADLGVSAGDDCLPQAELFPQGGLDPGQQYVGAIILDVPETTGTLVFDPAKFGGGSVRYEFKL